MFQKLASTICASISATRVFLVSQSKRVSELEDALADRLGAVDEFFFHADGGPFCASAGRRKS
jgi:hypothetical protein